MGLDVTVYTGNPSTNSNDAIRLLIGDTSTSTGIFSDAEIEYFSALKPNTALAASAAVQSLIGTTRGNTLAGVISLQVGDLKEEYSRTSISDILKAKAKSLRMIAVSQAKPYAGGISQADKDAKEAETDRVGSAFRVGEMDYTTSYSTQ